jgi:flagellum-specific ATP synthase
MIIGYTPGASLGAMCEIRTNEWAEPVLAEVVGFKDRQIFAMPLTDPTGIGMGTKLVIRSKEVLVSVGMGLIGRVVDGSGAIIDGKDPFRAEEDRSIYSSPPPALSRAPVSNSLDLGVRALNGFLTLGVGQRVGIFSGSGVGKSVLLGMLAKHSQSDVNVIALIGERGREVNEFIRDQLGEEGLKRSVIVVVTSDQSPLLRRRGAFTAITIAEYFRDKGMNVLLMMDSLTRFALAQREIGLSVGEPPTTKGYPPSVFSMLPQLLERAGNRQDGKGGITGLYTVLVEGDDMDDPIADSTRSIVDGHIVLSRDLAARNHFPAVDILQSVSRTMVHTTSPEHQQLAAKIREWVAVYRKNEDLITVGAYVKGANLILDEAVGKIEAIDALLRQPQNEKATMEQTLEAMRHIVRGG